MKATVIVCTRNRADSILETLEALTALEYSNFEILIVDSSTGSESERTAEVTKKFGAKYVPEPRRGLSLARNTGISAATGEIIFFTDDDCVPEKDWLTKIIKNYTSADVWACTSRVVQKHSGGASDLFEEVAGQDLGTEKRIFTPADIKGGLEFLFSNIGKLFAKHMKSSAPVPFGVGHGSSISFRKKIFETTGGFDERFGGGAPLKGCDDTEMLYRVLKTGHNIVYEPTSVVHHKHRLTSDDAGSSAARTQQESTAEEVFKTRYVYSFAGAAMMREFRKDTPMFLMYYGRLIQLLIKTAQYKLTRNTNLAKSFSADLHGFLDGSRAHKQLCRATK